MHSTRPRVCVQNVYVCAGNMPTCFYTCGHVAGTHGNVLNAHTGTFSMHTRRGGGEEGRGRERRVIASSAHQNGPRLDPREVHQKQPLDLTHLRFESTSRTTCHRFLQSFAKSDKGVPLQLS